MLRNLAHAPTFIQLDKDKDGAISPQEFSLHKAHRLQPKAP